MQQGSHGGAFVSKVVPFLSTVSQQTDAPQCTANKRS